MKNYSVLLKKIHEKLLKEDREKFAFITHYVQNIGTDAAKIYFDVAKNYVSENEAKSTKWTGLSFPPISFKKSKFTFIDLFAGIGGMRIAFQSVDGKCVFSSEWDKFAQDTYYKNFGEMPFGDITEIEAKDIPDHDVLVGGFPCQTFSIAGKRQGFNDTRGTLFFNVAKIIEKKQPKAFLLENVKGLRGHDKGKTLKTILRVLREDLKYNVPDPEILKAVDFGIPQNRQRIYIVGFKKKSVKFEYPIGTKVETKVDDILEDVVDNKYTISDKLWKGHKRRKKEHKEKGNGFGYSLFDEESQYTNTISARYYKDGSEVLIKQAGKNPRKLTPRECARLQGFDDKFEIPVSDVQAYKQFGNSVTVDVIEAIAKMIAETI